MTTAGVKLTPFLGGADSVTLDGDQLALVPVAETLSAGAPPSAPAVRSADAGRPVRRALGVAGVAVTAPLDVAPRPRLALSWAGLTRAERDALLGFLRDDCGDGEFGFEVALDGPGSTPVTLRALTPAEDSFDSRDGFAVSVNAEEVRS